MNSHSLAIVLNLDMYIAVDSSLSWTQLLNLYLCANLVGAGARWFRMSVLHSSYEHSPTGFGDVSDWLGKGTEDSTYVFY